MCRSQHSEAEILDRSSVRVSLNRWIAVKRIVEASGIGIVDLPLTQEAKRVDTERTVFIEFPRKFSRDGHLPYGPAVIVPWNRVLAMTSSNEPPTELLPRSNIETVQLLINVWFYGFILLDIKRWN
jgi:hypothetical protein